MTVVKVQAPNIQTVAFSVTGTAPLMTARFANKAALMAKMAEKAAPGKKAVREARDYEAEAEASAYIFEDGSFGFPAAAVRAAMISACRLVGFKMTIAKLSLFVHADGYDKRDYTPLIKIDQGYVVDTRHVRNATGVVDIRARPLYLPGWTSQIKIDYDADQFSQMDITNLLMRAGHQVGLCEGRPDSKSSAGLGFGTFALA